MVSMESSWEYAVVQPIKPHHEPVWRACKEECDVLQFQLGKQVAQVRKKTMRLVVEINNWKKTLEFFDIENGYIVAWLECNKHASDAWKVLEQHVSKKLKREVKIATSDEPTKNVANDAFVWVVLGLPEPEQASTAKRQGSQEPEQASTAKRRSAETEG